MNAGKTPVSVFIFDSDGSSSTSVFEKTVPTWYKNLIDDPQYSYWCVYSVDEMNKALKQDGAKATFRVSEDGVREVVFDSEEDYILYVLKRS